MLHPIVYLSIRGTVTKIGRVHSTLPNFSGTEDQIISNVPEIKC